MCCRGPTIGDIPSPQSCSHIISFHHSPPLPSGPQFRLRSILGHMDNNPNTGTIEAGYFLVLTF